MAEPTIRELGPLEHFRSVLHDLRFHCNVTVMARLSTDNLRHDDLRVLMYKAMSFAIASHPALRIGIIDQETRNAPPVFVHVPEIDLAETVSINQSTLASPDAKATDDALALQNSTPFASKKSPLWRLGVEQYKGPNGQCVLDITFTWHHAIGDGKSGLAALRSIMQGLNNAWTTKTDDCEASSERPAPYIVHTADAEIKPPLENIMRMPTSWSAYIRGVGKRLSFLWPQNRLIHKWSGEPYTFDEPITTNIRTVRIPIEDTRAILIRCRQERTTLTPLLQSLVGKIILEVVPAASYLKCSAAISLRRFFDDVHKITDNDMGLYINTLFLDVYRTNLGRSNVEFWNQVRKSSDCFQREISKGDLDIDSGALRGHTDFKPMLAAKRGQEREKSYGITNLGLFDPAISSGTQASQQQSACPLHWKLDEILFSQSCHANGAAIQFCIISSANGPLNIVLSWQRDVVTHELVEKVALSLHKELLAISSSTDTSLSAG